MSDWIRCADRMPRGARPVLVYDTECGDVLMAELVAGDFYEINGDRLYSVTHWMRPPKPPSQEPSK